MHDWPAFVREKLGWEVSEDVAQEIAGQLEDAYEDARGRGLSERDAIERALAEIPDWGTFAAAIARARRGDPRPTKWKRSLNADLIRDLRFGMRELVRNPGFTLVACFALALGIGANTVAFTFVKSLLFQRLPVNEPERLVRIYGSLPDSYEYATVSFADFAAIEERDELFSGVLVDKLIPLNLGLPAGNERIWGYMVSGRYFSVLGVSPALGRFFSYDDSPGGPPASDPVVVISYGFWQRAFGSAPDVIGETISLNGQPFEIVGVAPESFDGTALGLFPELWAPASMSDVVMPGFELWNRSNRSFLCAARLAAGVGIDEAQAGLDVLARQLQVEYPDFNRGIGFNVLPEIEGGIHPIMRGGFAGFSAVLVVVVGLVLLLACANVAGLLLTRAAHRSREIGLRTALGATRGRLVRQLLTESLVLAMLACSVGILAAWWVVRFFATLRPPVDLPLQLPMRPDGTMLVFAALVSIATGLFFGIVPALQASRVDLVATFTPSGGITARSSKLRYFLVAGQVALSTVLLVGAGLFVRGLSNAHAIDLGFNPDDVVIASVDLDLQSYELERGLAFFDTLGDRIRVLPEVESVAWANMIPFDIDINQNSVAPEGYEASEGGIPSVSRNIVSHEYFGTMKTRIVEGRDFTAHDDADAPPVVIVNETLARRFWPGASAIGKRMGRPGATMMEVVGVVEDGKYLTLGEDPTPVFFYPHPQRPSLDMTLVARTRAEPAAVLGRIRDEVRAMDAGLPLYDVKPMEEHLSVALAPARIGMVLLGSFGILALVLAAIGLYGILALHVTERTFEIGVRRALGASRWDIVNRVVRRALALALVGLAFGIVLSVLTSRVIASLLYGIDAVDAAVLVVTTLVLTGTAGVASIVPARRAIRIDPVVALRQE